MIEEEKWAAPSMTYFRPHFMVPALGDGNARAHDPPAAMTNGFFNGYPDQALDLGQNQQNQLKSQQQQHKPTPQPAPQQHTTIKHEQVDQSRYGFDQVNYSSNPPSTEKKKEEPERKYPCDQCSYIATQKSSLSRHKMTQHEGIRPPVVKTGKTFDCDACPYQATQLTSLKRHQMAKHSGQSFPCDKCEYIGTTPNNLRLHRGSKHEGVRYPCDICGYQATQTGVLNKHKELKHGFNRGTHHVNNNMHHTHYTSPPGPKPRAITNTAARAPLSGFYHFSSVGRPKIKGANPDWSDIEISKELSRRWHALDDITKNMFEEVAAQNNNQSEIEEARSWLKESTGGVMPTPGRIVQQQYHGNFRQKRAKKDPNAPKRSLCAFMFFSNDERQNVMSQNPNFGMGHRGEIVKELGRRWGVLSNEEKAKYHEMANADKERYEREKHEWHMKQRNQELDGTPSHTITYTPAQTMSPEIQFEEQSSMQEDGEGGNPPNGQMMSPQQNMHPTSPPTMTIHPQGSC